MKFKKILSGVLASAMLVSAMPAFSASAADKDPNGNSILDAVNITLGEIISSSFTYDDDDWYKFSIPSAGKVTITMDNSDNTTYFSLINGDDDATSLVNRYRLFSNTNVLTYYLTAGDYYIHFNAGFSRDYDMKVTFSSTNATPDEDNNTIAKATAVEYDGTIYKKQISLNDPVDYYTFNVAEQGKVTINFDSPMNATDWEIYDSENSKIKKGSFVRVVQDSGISAKESNIMKPGKYTIAFKKNDSYGDYSFSLDYLKNYNDTSVSGILAVADFDEDGAITAADASLVLAYYAYVSTGGTETDMNKWLASKK